MLYLPSIPVIVIPLTELSVVLSSDCPAEVSVVASALTAVDVSDNEDTSVAHDNIPANVLFILLTFVATVIIHLSVVSFMSNRKYANFDELRNLSVHIVVRVVNGNFSVLKLNTHFISAPYTWAIQARLIKKKPVRM